VHGVVARDDAEPTGQAAGDPDPGRLDQRLGTEGLNVHGTSPA
jgi:hypothetical protein